MHDVYFVCFCMTKGPSDPGVVTDLAYLELVSGLSGRHRLIELSSDASFNISTVHSMS